MSIQVCRGVTMIAMASHITVPEVASTERHVDPMLLDVCLPVCLAFPLRRISAMHGRATPGLTIPLATAPFSKSMESSPVSISFLTGTVPRTSATEGGFAVGGDAGQHGALR